MATPHDPHAFNVPFEIVRKGYDRDQVISFLRRFDAELRLTATDRDAAAAQANDLAEQLDGARDEIDELRREIDRLSVPPTTAEGMSDRISRMLRLASDEASEMRARAETEAAEVLSVAEQNAEELRARHRTKLDELAERRATLEQEHEKTMELARSQVTRMHDEAESDRRRLDAEAETRRVQAREQTEREMAELRKSTTAASEEVARTSAAEAARRVREATDESRKRIARARRDHEEIRKLRQRVLEQLLTVSGQLESIPAMHAAVMNEPLIDESDFDWNTNDFSGDPAAKKPTDQSATTPDARGRGPKDAPKAGQPEKDTAKPDDVAQAKKPDPVRNGAKS
ncbi:hypothetical protein G4X40_21965 [Rhodococcus sp. D2-41]|uniref:Antigen 84 n=1 Tax=Speluncibacter jeojiensis TaxID=2710754 RepID=A0A9X4M309_9ACTN|nr:hypothetical protein [Rhodococcus sp. D2-41]MDG3012810.1 hypothetical protein [Rhodococcus sp. D2-41]MDG3017128.1 hypothetical protein [Corynebacteriales bacterium D3-21]